MFICAGSIAIGSLFVGCCVSNTISWEVGFTILLELLGHYSHEIIIITTSLTSIMLRKELSPSLTIKSTSVLNA